MIALGCTEGGLCEGTAVGIVGHDHITPEGDSKVLRKRAIIQAKGVGVSEKSCGGDDDSGSADAND